MTDRQTDRRTDGIAIAYARLQHMLSRAKTDFTSFMTQSTNGSSAKRFTPGLNKIFSTVGTNLVNNVINDNPLFNSNDYRSYCNVSIKESIFLAPVTNFIY